MNMKHSTPVRVVFYSFALLGLLAGPAFAGSEASSKRSAEAPEATVKGRVFADSSPLEAVKVYAYEVASYAMKRVTTDGRGHFSFRGLPAGMYQIVAHKEGFSPTVEFLLRRNGKENQFVKILLREESDDPRQAEDYWSVRAHIPADVLRDINTPESNFESPLAPGVQLADGKHFAGQMHAQGGMEQLGRAYGEAQLTTAEVALQGAVGDIKVGLTGSFQRLTQVRDEAAEAMPDGASQSVIVEVEPSENSHLTMAMATGQQVGLQGSQLAPVDLESYQLSWSGQTGRKSRSGLTAHYLDETNLYQMGWLTPTDTPGASRSLNLEGFYNTEFGHHTSLKTGISYRQLEGETTLVGSAKSNQSPGSASFDNQAFDLYGVANTQIQPRILVEYGLYSSVRDGSISLMPHGGMVIHLGGDWQARTAFSQRIEDGGENTARRGFDSASFDDTTTCQKAGDACYEIKFAHRSGTDNSIALGAVHREFAETLRLYFSPDFFNRLESVFVVEGDSVPELQFSMVRRISPRVLAKLESNFASGGGGIFYATDKLAYENKVRYLVTSLDTRFQSTATGIFVAFHHLEQALSPLRNGQAAADVQMQRLQVMLTQDLSALTDLTANFAVRFNFELSRGASPYTLTPDDELRKKLTGGISVSF